MKKLLKIRTQKFISYHIHKMFRLYYIYTYFGIFKSSLMKFFKLIWHNIPQRTSMSTLFDRISFIFVIRRHFTFQDSNSRQTSAAQSLDHSRGRFSHLLCMKLLFLNNRIHKNPVGTLLVAFV
jgi:hypothetical protein